MDVFDTSTTQLQDTISEIYSDAVSISISPTELNEVNTTSVIPPVVPLPEKPSLSARTMCLLLISLVSIIWTILMVATLTCPLVGWMLSMFLQCLFLFLWFAFHPKEKQYRQLNRWEKILLVVRQTSNCTPRCFMMWTVFALLFFGIPAVSIKFWEPLPLDKYPVCCYYSFLFGNFLA